MTRKPPPDKGIKPKREEGAEARSRSRGRSLVPASQREVRSAEERKSYNPISDVKREEGVATMFFDSFPPWSDYPIEDSPAG